MRRSALSTALTRSRRTRSLVTALCTAVALAAAALVDADGAPPSPSGPSPGIDDNFGFPMGFHVSKMDASADPRRDFARHAAGKWLDVATIPSDAANLDGIMLLTKRVQKQVASVLFDAAAASPNARKGTPLQQVGDLYAAGMDVERLKALGVGPLQPEWERIAKIDGPKALAAELARLSLVTNQPVVFGISVSLGLVDPSRYVMTATDADLPMPALENYLSPESASVRETYVQTIANTLVLAGVPAEQARARAAKVLEMETRIAAKKLTPVQQRDIGAVYQTVPYAELKAMLGHLDLDTLVTTLGLPTRGDVLITETAAVRERNAMLADYTLEDTKAYLQWEALRLTTPYLSPALVDAQALLTRALTGQAELPKRELVVAGTVAHGVGCTSSATSRPRVGPTPTRS